MKVFGLILCLSLLYPIQKICESPNSEFEILKQGEDTGDERSRLNYYIKAQNSSELFLFTTSEIRDLLAPVFWWTSDSKTLIYEHKIEGGDSTSINLYDPINKKIVCSVNGYFNTQMDQQELFMSKKRNMILYFKRLERPNIQLSALDLTNCHTTPILTFEHHDYMESPQLKKFNEYSGEIILSVLTTDLRHKEVKTSL